MADKPHPRLESAGAGKILKESACGFDSIEISGHALEQMEIRSISEADVLQTLRQPDRTDLPTETGRKRYRRNKTARTAIDVVWEETAGRLGVVTAIKIERRIIERGRR